MFFSKNAPLFKMVFGHAGHAGHAASHETDEARITFKYLHPVTQDYVRIWVPVPTFKSAELRTTTESWGHPDVCWHVL